MSFSAAEDEKDSANLPLRILADAALDGREPTMSQLDGRSSITHRRPA